MSQADLNAEAVRLGLSPARFDGPDDRLTGDQCETFETDFRENPDEVGILGFNDAGWFVYRLNGVMTAVHPDGEAYIGRDAHLRRFKDEDDL